MIPVMIVDDEFIVRVALKSIVDWESLGYTIVAEAKNGQEGIEKFKEHRPALIMTDVSMPVMNGLEMMAAIKRIDDSVCFVVLSAYEEFSFVKKALQLSADEYLLKASMMEEDMEELLRRLFSSLLKKNMNKKSVLDREIIEQWCKGKISAEDTERINHFVFNGKQVDRIYCCHLVGNIEKAVGKQEMVLSLVYNIMDNKNIRFLSGMEGSNIFILTEETDMESALSMIRNSIDRYFGSSILIGASCKIQDIKEMNYYHSQAVQASRNAIFYPDKVYKEFDSKMQFSYDTSNKSLMNQLENALMIVSREESLKVVKQLFENVRNKKNYKFLYSVILAICAAISNFYDLTEAKSDPESILKLASINDIEETVINNLENTLRIIENRQPRETIYIQEAKKYVREHYSENISLGIVAEKLHITPNYLGRLFFEQTQMRIMDYLNIVRIDQACELMKNKEISLSYISGAVGFNNQSYFSACFQKIKKISPREYRKKI